MSDLPASRPAHGVDLHVGMQVRLRRSELRMSQDTLADHLGLTFQQVQKYERGANRISASKLYQIARALDVPVGWFFEGLGDDVNADRAASVPQCHAMLSTTEGIALANLFPKIPRARVRRGMVDLVRAMVDAGPSGDDA